MSRPQRTIAAVAAAIALAVPATAGADRPSPGRYYNDSNATGLYLVTTDRTIRTLHLYCAGNGWYTRSTRYEVRRPIHIRRDGSFSYRGTADRYGPNGQWYGIRKVRLSGRFTSATGVVIRRTLSRCGTATATGKRIR